MLEAAVGIAILALLIAAGAVGYGWWAHGQMRSRTRALDEAQDRFEAQLDARLLAMQQDASRTAGGLKDLAQQVSALSVRQTAANTAKPAEAAPAAPGAGGPRVRGRRTESGPPAVPSGPSLDTVLADYRLAAEDLAARGDAFIETYAPVGVARAQDGEGYRPEPDPRAAFLWAVPHAGGWMLAPGYRALKDWRSHFAAQREHNGQAYFGDAFRLDGSGGRFEVEPAAARREGDRFVVVRPGTISGFRG